MKLALAALLLYLTSEVYSLTPVIIVCVVKSGEDIVIKRTDKKSQANWCIYEIKDCEKAQLLVRVDTQAAISAYSSSYAGTCD